MKHLKPILEATQFLIALYLIYGVCGSYEQGITTGTQFIKQLLITSIILAVINLVKKALTAVIRNKKYEFLKSKNNRRQIFDMLQSPTTDFIVAYQIKKVNSQKSQRKCDLRRI